MGAIARDIAVEVFTTNYDVLIEQALEDARVPYFDGFVGGHRPFFDLRAIEDDAIPSRWARLWKLHGSVNWCFSPDDQRVTRRAPANGAERRLIHPSHLKYDESRRMPYLGMIDRLRGFLRSPQAVLVLCGCSFGDKHLNEVIAEGLQGNATATSFALLYEPLASYPSAIELTRTTRNLALLARDAGVIGGSQGEWTVTGRRGPPRDAGGPASPPRPAGLAVRRTDRQHRERRGDPRADRRQPAADEALGDRGLRRAFSRRSSALCCASSTTRCSGRETSPRGRANGRCSWCSRRRTRTSAAGRQAQRP